MGLKDGVRPGGRETLMQWSLTARPVKATDSTTGADDSKRYVRERASLSGIRGSMAHGAALDSLASLMPLPVVSGLPLSAPLGAAL